MRENFVETLVGVIVIAISVFFIAYGYSVTDTQSSDNINISADFERIDGLTIGSDVRLSGVKIGTVTGTELDKESFSARVNMSLDSSIELPDDSSAKITSEGLLGGNYISVVPGGSDMALEPGGEIMFTQGSVDLMSLISQAMFSTGNSSNEPQLTPFQYLSLLYLWRLSLLWQIYIWRMSRRHRYPMLMSLSKIEQSKKMVMNHYL